MKEFIVSSFVCVFFVNNMFWEGWIGDHTCSLCGAADETASHLFLQCEINEQGR